MKSRARRAFTIAAAAAALAAAQAPAHSQEMPGTVKGHHGAWSTVCGQPAGAPEDQCAIMQLVVAKDRPDVAISVVALKTADKQADILKVIVPLGILLPKGLGLIIDGKDVGRAYYLMCRSYGCEVQVTIDKGLMQTLRNGKQAVFTIYKTQEAGIGIPVELNGFAAGFDALP